MHMKIKQKKLIDIIGVIRPITDEIKLVFKTDGIHISKTDPASNQLIMITIKKEICDEYSTEDLEIGIDLNKLYNFVKIFKKDDMFSFEYDPDSNRLIARAGNLTRTFGLTDTAWLPDPEKIKCVFNKKIEINTDLLLTTIKGLLPDRKYLEPVHFWATEEGLNLLYIEEDEDNAAVILKDQLISFYSEDNQHSRYDCSYLLSELKMLKKLFTELKLEFNYNMPIFVSNENSEIKIEYWLAPRINHEDIASVKEEVVEPEVEKQEVKTEPEIKEVIPFEPLIPNLEYGSTDLLFYKKEVFVTGDFEHIDKEDILVNVQLLLEIFGKYSKKIKKLVGVHKDYDKDYVYLLVNDSKKHDDLAQGVKVFSNTKAKDYFESRQKYDSKKWLTFNEFVGHEKQEIKPENEAKEIVKELELPEKPPLEDQISDEKSGVTTEKLHSKAKKRPMEPIIAVQPKKEVIGSRAIVRTKTKLEGEIVGITKTGYLILFRGQTSRTLREPIEIEKDLVKIYEE